MRRSNPLAATMAAAMAATMTVAAVATAGLALAGCGADAASSAGTVAPNGETSTVLALDNSFSPKDLTISAGTEVVWENRGRNDHNVIPENPSDPWRVDTEHLQPGDTASWIFTEPGTYRYYCSIHGTIDAGMPGVVIVE